MDGKTKVLLIEDDPFMRLLVKKSFESDDYNFLEASEGPPGIETALKEMPQLIIVDLMLPTMSGWDIIKAIRDNAAVKHIPILVCTSKDKSVDIHKCFDMGANDYISKPFDTKRLRYKAKKLMGHPLPQE